MQVKKFRADTIQEATNRVKQELGPDALILSTRKLHKEKGAFAYGPQASFEITAVQGRSYQGATGLHATSPTSLDFVKSELMTIKEMVLLLNSSGHLIEGFRANPSAIDLYGKLLRCGIAESNAQMFLRKAGAFDEREQSNYNRLHERVLKEVLRVINILNPFEQSEEQIVAAFVGPTGVGKTTTIAKLMADLSLKQKRKVGLISIDNYRIGAIEQLKAYAAILGVPFFPAFSSTDLQFALRRLKEKDVILIDTAGQSHYDMSRMEEMAELIGTDHSIKSHLVLSTRISELEMDSAARGFSRLNLSSYVFTKTDEARIRGVIINQVLKLGMPLSFITTGQRVPEDICKATKTGILKLILQ